MSEHSTPEERTEMPTEKRMTEMRREGQLYMSTDVATAASLFAGFGMLLLTWNWFLRDIKYCIIKSFTMIGNSESLTIHDFQQGGLALVLLFGPALFVLSVTIGFVAAMSVFLQTDYNIKEKWIQFKFSSLNPIQGVKKVFSVQGITNTLKAIAKLCVILPIGYFSLKELAPNMVMLIHVSVDQIMSFMGEAVFVIFWKIFYALVIIAIIDFMWGKFQWLKQNKMTKQEVKDERKAVEGDEGTKKKIQMKGLQRIMQRIRDSVPQADVVITNPTHFAVALKYDRDSMRAPTVVAKGKGFLALRIREIAKENGVPILERKPLARALYAATEVGTEIPAELFKAVAKILAYVYKLKNPHRFAQQNR
jgi:flagellar biosynthetic protein FlhB